MKYTDKINQLLGTLTKYKLITKSTQQIIKPLINIETSNLYFLPKLHKAPTISGRPISSANGHPAENISIFLDVVLKEYAINQPLYLRDGPQLLESLNNMNSIPQHALLFSIDVINMYPSIPIQELINTIYEVTSNNLQPLNTSQFKLTPDAIRILLKTVLYTNYFTFNDTFYEQTHGVAMGTPCACTITDIFICKFVEKHFFNWTFLPRFYRQYRDDSFGIWLHGEETLKEYLIYLNTLHETIQFTLSFGKQIQYLDLNINITSWGTCNTETYYKPTDNFQYLDANSNHPQSTINNIPKSQLLRHIRNCSTSSALLAHTSILAHNLKKRTYPIKTINEKFKSMLHITRSNRLKIHKKSLNNRTPLIITFNSNTQNLQRLVRENMPTPLAENPPLLAFRIQKTLGNYLIKAKYKSCDQTN